MSSGDARSILVVEDEPHVLRGLTDLLAYRGFRPQGVGSGEDALALVRRAPPDLILLDVQLPGLDGFEVCRRVRADLEWIPIVMLTARDAEQDVLRGFACGADDYVTKPFSVAEVIARVEAVLRRADPLGRVAASFALGEWTIDPERMCGSARGTVVELTRREVELLAFFHREAGRIVSRRSLLAQVWRMQAADRVDTRTVDMHIARLRRKLGAHELIETVRGEGYRVAGGT